MKGTGCPKDAAAILPLPPADKLARPRPTEVEIVLRRRAGECERANASDLEVGGVLQKLPQRLDDSRISHRSRDSFHSLFQPSLSSSSDCCFCTKGISADLGAALEEVIDLTINFPERLRRSSSEFKPADHSPDPSLRDRAKSLCQPGTSPGCGKKFDNIHEPHEGSD